MDDTCTTCSRHLYQLPAELVGEIATFLPTASILCLWLSGCPAIRRSLCAPYGVTRIDLCDTSKYSTSRWPMMIGELKGLKELVVHRPEGPLGSSSLIWGQLNRLRGLVILDISCMNDHDIFMEGFKPKSASISTPSSSSAAPKSFNHNFDKKVTAAPKKSSLLQSEAQNGSDNVLDLALIFPSLQRLVWHGFNMKKLGQTQHLNFPKTLTDLQVVHSSAAKLGTILSSLTRFACMWQPTVQQRIFHVQPRVAASSSDLPPIHSFLPNLTSFTSKTALSSNEWISTLPKTLTELILDSSEPLPLHLLAELKTPLRRLKLNLSCSRQHLDLEQCETLRELYIQCDWSVPTMLLPPRLLLLSVQATDSPYSDNNEIALPYTLTSLNTNLTHVIFSLQPDPDVPDFSTPSGSTTSSQSPKNSATSSHGQLLPASLTVLTTNVKLRHQNGTKLATHLPSLFHLTSLTIQGAVTRNLLELIPNTLTHLGVCLDEYVRIVHCPFQPSLTSLHLTTLQTFSPQDLEWIPDSVVHLSLSAAKTWDAEEIGVVQFPRTLRTLSLKFSISHPPLRLTKEWLAMLQPLEQLEILRLDFDVAWSVANEDMLLLPRNLQELVITGETGKLTGEVFGYLPRRLHTLQFSQLAVESFLTPQTTRAFLKSLPRGLRKLTLPFYAFECEPEDVIALPTTLQTCTFAPNKSTISSITGSKKRLADARERLADTKAYPDSRTAANSFHLNAAKEPRNPVLQRGASYYAQTILDAISPVTEIIRIGARKTRYKGKK